MEINQLTLSYSSLLHFRILAVFNIKFISIFIWLIMHSHLIDFNCFWKSSCSVNFSKKDNKIRKWLNHFEQQQHQDGPVFAHQKDLSSVITVSKRKKYWLKILPAFQNDYLLELNNNEICHIWWNLLCGWKSFEWKKISGYFCGWMISVNKYFVIDYFYPTYVSSWFKNSTFFWK